MAHVVADGTGKSVMAITPDGHEVPIETRKHQPNAVEAVFGYGPKVQMIYDVSVGQSAVKTKVATSGPGVVGTFHLYEHKVRDSVPDILRAFDQAGFERPVVSTPVMTDLRRLASKTLHVVQDIGHAAHNVLRFH